jgi:cbb3-type cytochrome oxidase subunit 3
MSDIITGAVISIIALILGFVANIIYESRREKKKIRNESLRNHFQ